jgi:uncharacterized protein (TIGR03067 family)
LFTRESVVARHRRDTVTEWCTSVRKTVRRFVSQLSWHFIPKEPPVVRTAFGVFVYVISAASVGAEPPMNEKIIAAIQKLGGAVELDAKLPGQPIVKIDLHGSGVTDADLVKLKPLAELHVLDLRLTKISDAGVAHLQGLKQLRFVNLFRTPVSDAALKSLTGNTQLETLLVGGTKITNAGLAHLAAFPRLKKLSVFDTQIGDDGLQHLMGLSNLEVLLVGKSRVTDAGTQAIQKALPKVRFSESAVAVGADAKRLLGEWTAVGSYDADGKLEQLKDDDPRKFVFEFTADKLFTKLGKQTLEGSYQVNVLKNPIEIDVVRRRNNKDARFPGICVINGDQLKVCLAGTGRERPTEYKSGDGIEFAVLLKRVKK